MKHTVYSTVYVFIAQLDIGNGMPLEFCAMLTESVLLSQPQRNATSTSTLQLGWTRTVQTTPPQYPTTTQTQHQAIGAPDDHLLTTT